MLNCDKAAELDWDKQHEILNKINGEKGFEWDYIDEADDCDLF